MNSEAAQILELAYVLRCDVLFIAQTSQLVGSGVPSDVLLKHPDVLPIRLDAGYHEKQRWHLDEQGFTVALSFNGLSTCRFPWSSIIAITIYPTAPPLDTIYPTAPPLEARAEPSEGRVTLVRPVLRLVDP